MGDNWFISYLPAWIMLGILVAFALYIRKGDRDGPKPLE